MLYNIGERPHWNKEGGGSSSIHTHFAAYKGRPPVLAGAQRHTRRAVTVGPPDGLSTLAPWEAVVGVLFWVTTVRS